MRNIEHPLLWLQVDVEDLVDATQQLLERKQQHAAQVGSSCPAAAAAAYKLMRPGCTGQVTQ
jgi:DNA-binding MurR/RpiR family transcriptional regulator